MVGRNYHHACCLMAATIFSGGSLLSAKCVEVRVCGLLCRDNNSEVTTSVFLAEKCLPEVNNVILQGGFTVRASQMRVIGNPACGSSADRTRKRKRRRDIAFEPQTEAVQRT